MGFVVAEEAGYAFGQLTLWDCPARRRMLVGSPACMPDPTPDRAAGERPCNIFSLFFYDDAIGNLVSRPEIGYADAKR